MWKDAFNEVKKPKTIVLAGILMGINVILGMFEIPIIPQMLYISFGYVSVSVLGFLCGPIVGALAGGICDILKFMANPQGAFFFGFTLNEILTGFIFGLFLYKQKPTLTRSFLCKLTVTVSINLLLTPLWLKIMYGSNSFAWSVVKLRLIKNALLLPIESTIMFYVLKLAAKSKIVK